MPKLQVKTSDHVNLYKPEHLQQRLEFPIDVILKILERKSSKVRQFVITTVKENGKKKDRTIYTPDREFKALLRRVNGKLLNKITLPEGVCGAVIGKSLIDMVKTHCSKEAVYQVDLEKFFPNISYRTVVNILLKLNISKEVANLLTDLVTFENQLPQGFPTSPMIANLVAMKLDYEQIEICKKFNISRTRWIDDIAFSGRIKDLELAIPKILTSIEKNHFILNEEKEKFSRRKDKPEIVGLSITKHRPYVPLRIVNKIEEFIFVIKQSGYSKLKELYPEDFKKNDVKTSLLGKIRHIEKFDVKTAYILRDKLIRFGV